jgi:LCP family protein required for cell wall assembly
MSEFRDRSRRLPTAEAGVRHGRQSRSAAWKTILGLVGGAVVVALVAGGSIAAIALRQLESNIHTVAIGADKAGPPPNIAAMKGGFNILLAGSDTREGQGGIGGGVKADDSVLNDVTMLMHVAQDQKSAVVVSIPRDMVVPIPKCQNGGPASGLPINTTLYYGGLACTVATVENLTGLKIQFAGLITFTGVIAMSDAVGGVDVCVNAPIKDPYTGLDLPKAGTYTLQGADALAFLRSRHGVGDGSDLGRISSQQVYLSSLVRKLKSSDTLTNIGKLYAIAQAATQNITLSENFTRLDTLVSVALVLKNIPLDHIVFVQYPGVTGGTGMYAGKVQPVKSVATALFDAIKADKPIALSASSVGGNDPHAGSTLDPNAPAPSPSSTASGSASGSGSGSDSGSGDSDAQVITGVQGQTAAQYTCSVAYHY